MEFSITIRGIHEREAAREDKAMRNYITEKFARIEKILEKEQEPIFVEVVVTVQSPHPHHEVEMHIREPRNHIIIKREGPEAYKVIDQVLDETYRQVNNQKERRVDNERREGFERKRRDREKI